MKKDYNRHCHSLLRIEEVPFLFVFVLSPLRTIQHLEETYGDIDILVDNVTNFYYWCASRVLTLDRKYAKEILNSIGASQAVTDRDRLLSV